MHGSALGAYIDATFGDTGVVSGVAGAHLETRVLALLKKMQSANLMPPASQPKSKQSRLTAHLGPKSGKPPSASPVCSSASSFAKAICLTDVPVHLPIFLAHTSPRLPILLAHVPPHLPICPIRLFICPPASPSAQRRKSCLQHNNCRTACWHEQVLRQIHVN